VAKIIVNEAPRKSKSAGLSETSPRWLMWRLDAQSREIDSLKSELERLRNDMAGSLADLQAKVGELVTTATTKVGQLQAEVDTLSTRPSPEDVQALVDNLTTAIESISGTGSTETSPVDPTEGATVDAGDTTAATA
jgi:hypothetical protein